MKNKILLNSIVVILVLTIIVSSYMLIKRFLDYDNANKHYAKKQEQYTEIISLPEEIEETEKEKPPITVDFKNLLKENNEVVGWLYCDDTPINYPVVQSGDNNTYLKSGLDNKYLISGTIFTDFRNSEPGFDENYIIYGHNMRNSSMFGTIDNYSSQSYYEKHPYLYFLTPEANYKIKALAGKVVPYNDKIYQIKPDTDEFYNHLEGIIKNSSFKSDFDYNRGDKIVTLSTCTNNSDRTRYVLIGKLVELN